MNAQEAISELILNAARGAVPADAEHLMLLPDCGPRNKRLMPLLIGLVDALKVTARAVEDNALDEGYPVDAALRFRLQAGLRQVESALSVATTAIKKPA